MQKDTILNEQHKSYASSMHKDMIFNKLYLSYASSMHNDTIFNILNEFIHIICIENKETILIGVTSGSDTTLGFLLAIKHAYIAEKLKILLFLARPRIHVIRSDDLEIEYLILTGRSLCHNIVCASNPPCQTKRHSRSLHPLQLPTQTSLLRKPRETSVLALG